MRWVGCLVTLLMCTNRHGSECQPADLDFFAGAWFLFVLVLLDVGLLGRAFDVRIAVS